MTKTRRFFIIIFALAAAVFIVALLPRTNGQRAEAAVSPDNNFWFESIDVSIEVRTDKTYAVTETMEVGFTYSGVNTGIIRDIQRQSRTTRIIDGVKKKGKAYIAKISDVESRIDDARAGMTMSVIEEGDYYSVELYRPDESYFGATRDEGTHTFVLSYVYDVSDDRMKGFDDFTFALQNEFQELTEEDKQILLSLAKQLNQARKRLDDKSP